MLKNLSIAAILLAATLANASELNTSTGVDTTATEQNQFDQGTLNDTTEVTATTETKSKKSKKASSSSSSSSSDSSSSSSSGSSSSSSGSSSSSSGSSSSSDSDSDSSSSSSSSGSSSASGSSSSSSSSGSSSDSDSSSDSSSSGSDSSSGSESDKKKSKKTKITGTKAFKKSHGKKWLKSAEKAKEHDIAVIRQKSKIDSKGKKHKHARKAKVASVKNTLKLKSKKPVKITVDSNGIKKGLVVKDGDKKLFKATGSKYAILKEGNHEISVAANKKNVEGTASLKVEEVKISKKVAKKYKFVANTVQASDAQDLCERFGGNLAEVKAKDIAKIVKAAKKMVSAGMSEVWIDRVITEKDETYSYFPTTLNLSTSETVVDPDSLYSECSEYAKKQIEAITAKDKKSKKYKKALAKAQAKIRKHMDKALDGKDKTKARAVLCRFD